MRNFVLALALAIGLTACNGSAVSTQASQAALIACSTYALVLNQLAPLRRAGTLSAGQVTTVNRIEPVLTSACTQTITPESAVLISNQMVELIGVRSAAGVR